MLGLHPKVPSTNQKSGGAFVANPCECECECECENTLDFDVGMDIYYSDILVFNQCTLLS